MRVGVNSAVISGRMTGVGYHALSLVRALARVGKGIEWVLMGADPATDSLPRADNIQIIGADHLPGGARRAIWQQWTLPRLVTRAGVDLLYCPDYSRPIFCGTPVVNTIHDLSFYSSSPPFLPMASRLWKGSLARVAIARSTRLIVDSNFIRDELLQRFRVDPQRVTVINLAAEELPDQPRQRADRPFLLFVGTQEARKNLVTLIKAFTALRANGRIPHRLVLVGQPGYGWPQIEAAIATSPFHNDIEVRGYETRQEVLRLYRSADLFVFPSLYEGFGLPLLEAMACGAPVACARAASLPEVAGDAAEYFDPQSSEDMAAAIERVVQSPEVQESLRRKGRERLKQFSWDECARRHCEVFREVVESS
jgi:glycosyltransferase involved in cell wall biosynthesis